MSVKDNKIAVLRQLREEAEPISMPQLLKKLGNHFKERSVRRWLHLLIEEGAVQKIGKNKGAKYSACTAFEIGKASSFFSPGSLEAIDQISRPLFEGEQTLRNVS